MKSLKDLISFKKTKPTSSDVLIKNASFIWRGSIFFLILLAVGVILFDGYIFLFRVQELEEQSKDVSAEVQVAGLSKSLLETAREHLRQRKDLFDNASSTVPDKNPFE